jgi:cytochrome c peroxidase
MPKTTLALLIAFSVGTPVAFAAEDAGTQITRPAGYKPMTGDAKLGEKLFKDVKLSTNGMSCATCHANHGAFQASFAKPYPHTVAMAKEQVGRKTVYLDEMVQVCMVMPMAAKPLAWNSRELAGLVAYLQVQQKSFKPSR